MDIYFSLEMSEEVRNCMAKLCYLPTYLTCTYLDVREVCRGLQGCSHLKVCLLKTVIFVLPNTVREAPHR
jgi:hypothetical protein